MERPDAIPTIGIVGGSISGNKGAEAMVTSVIHSLRRRLGKVRFVIFSPYARADRELQGRYPDTEVVASSPISLVTSMLAGSLASWAIRRVSPRAAVGPRQLKLLAGCDLVIDVAGISFSDGREKYLPYNIFTVVPAMLLGKKVAKLSQAMGPFENRINRAAAKAMLRRCELVVSRGSHTSANLRAIGLDGFMECPDTAFVLDESGDKSAIDSGLDRYLKFGSPGRRLVGVSPSSEVYGRCRRCGVDYAGVCAAFCRDLIGSGYRLLLLPHSYRPGSRKLKNNDLPVIKLVMAALGPTPEAMVMEEDLDSLALRRLIGGCDFFLASRFHSMIAALATNVPVMVCGWGHKYFEILDLFGQRERAFDYRQLSPERMRETFNDLVRHEQQIRRQMRDAMPGVMVRAGEQMDAVVELLGRQRCS